MSALDVSVQAAISELLMNLQRESKTTMVFISHDLSVVRYLADRVVVMYLGHIVEMGATAQIFSPPFHPYTEALLSAIPIADPTVKKRHVVLEGEIPSALSPPKGCPFQTRCGHKREVAGDLCEREVPPARRSPPGHTIKCHLPLAALQAMAPVFFKAETQAAARMVEGKLTLSQAEAYAQQACLAVGASPAQARALSRATVAAEAIGRRSVGFAHLPDYLDGFLQRSHCARRRARAGQPVAGAHRLRRAGRACSIRFRSRLRRPLPRAQTFGVALFALSNGFTAGEVGYYARRLAERDSSAMPPPMGRRSSRRRAGARRSIAPTRLRSLRPLQGGHPC